MIMNVLRIAIATLSLMGLMGCSAIKDAAVNKVTSAVGLGGETNNVSTMWPDVPVIDGAIKGEYQLPLTARLIMKTITGGVADMITYATTKSPQEVQAFYTLARMKNTGWVEGGCAQEAAKALAEKDDASAAMMANMLGEINMCGFNKIGATKDEVLIIIISPPDANEKVKSTKIFFLRGHTGEKKTGK
jgi:hypothetical protein